MPQYKTLDSLDVGGRTVLLRGDLNVPMKDGKVTDATRIDRLVPTIEELLDKGAKVVLMSHFGRPKGKPDPACSLAPVAEAVSAHLPGRSVRFVPALVGEEAESAVAGAPAGTVLVLENLRFDPGEEANDKEFAAALARLGDLYVNDAFSAAHRAHASTEALAHLLPSAAGRLMQAEVEALTRALEAPRRPVLAVVGGAKISTKLEVLGNLVAKVDYLALGGGMANTFLAADGIEVGASLHEADMAEEARRIMERAKSAGCAILLPEDAVVAEALEEGVDSETVAIDAVPKGAKILDIGPASIGRLDKAIEASATVLWNGPLGVFEVPPFDTGTNAVAAQVAGRTRAGRMLSVAGGGDTVAALAHAGVLDDFSYVSTAGGAFLEWLEGKTLPGVAALEA